MHAETAVTTAGLLLSLAHDLPDPRCALANRARRLARRLSDGATPSALAGPAAAVLAQLLDAADFGEHADDPDCLYADFDR